MMECTAQNTHPLSDLQYLCYRFSAQHPLAEQSTETEVQTAPKQALIKPTTVWSNFDPRWLVVGAATTFSPLVD